MTIHQTITASSPSALETLVTAAESEGWTREGGMSSFTDDGVTATCQQVMSRELPDPEPDPEVTPDA